MFKLYINMLYRVFEKMPFFPFIVRMWRFCQGPKISDKKYCKDSLEYSALDILNGLGLVAVVSAFLVFVSTDYSYFKIAKAINPFYISVVYFIHGLIFSIVVALGTAILLKTSLIDIKRKFSINIYIIFSHCLRFYAIYGVLLGIPFVAIVGKLLLNGENIGGNEGFFTIFCGIVYSFGILIWFPYRLLFNPIFSYAKFKNFFAIKFAGFMILILIIYLGIYMNALAPIPSSVTERIFYKNELCEIFKSGDLYKSVSKNMQSEVETLICQ